jgi:hypothetical protein
MKIFATTLLLLIATTTVALAEVPVCAAMGTRSEGWYLKKRLIIFAKCQGAEEFPYYEFMQRLFNQQTKFPSECLAQASNSQGINFEVAMQKRGNKMNLRVSEEGQFLISATPTGKWKINHINTSNESNSTQRTVTTHSLVLVYDSLKQQIVGLSVRDSAPPIYKKQLDCGLTQ